MNKLSLSEVMIDATCLLESGNLNPEETRAICGTIVGLIGREIVICDSGAQQKWLIAKAWSIAAGGMSKRGRKFGHRKKMDLEVIRSILAEVPVGD